MDQGWRKLVKAQSKCPGPRKADWARDHTRRYMSAKTGWQGDRSWAYLALRRVASSRLHKSLGHPKSPRAIFHSNQTNSRYLQGLEGQRY